MRIDFDFADAGPAVKAPAAGVLSSAVMTVPLLMLAWALFVAILQ